MADRERLVKTLIDLIKIDSPSGEEDAMDLEVSSRLEALGLTVSHDSYNNVIAKLAGQGQPVMLSAHLDTVSQAGASSPWLSEACCGPTAAPSWAATVRRGWPSSWRP